ncbi:MAG: hypothetical protein ACRDNI_10200 [Gaiellaceae bacterium]
MSPVRPTVTLIGRRLEPEHHRVRACRSRGRRWLRMPFSREV